MTYYTYYDISMYIHAHRDIDTDRCVYVHAHMCVYDVMNVYAHVCPHFERITISAGCDLSRRTEANVRMYIYIYIYIQ